MDQLAFHLTSTRTICLDCATVGFNPRQCTASFRNGQLHLLVVIIDKNVEKKTPSMCGLPARVLRAYDSAMKLHHAAVIVLVSWYLMVPPLNSPSDPILHVPLSKWTVQERFDSKDDCQLGHFRSIDIAQKQRANDYPFLLTIAEAECIEGDDPRLKGK